MQRLFGSRYIDWLIVLPILYLLALGVIILRAIAEGPFSDIQLQTQYLAIAIGAVVFVVTSATDYRVWIRVAPWVYAAAIVSLIAVLFFAPVQGARRWIDIGSFQFQPSELAKFGLIIITARLLAIRKDLVNRPLSFVVVATYVAVPTVLVLLQPDLGTAITVGLIWFAMLSVSRLRRKTLVLMIIMGLLVIPATVPFLADYQRERVTTFLNPASDPLGSGYNVRQATIAVGSGGVLGKGLDAGTQSQFSFLPSQHTDFIFAVLAEKLGLIGALSVILAFVLLLMRTVVIAWTARSEFGRYTAVGVLIVFGLQAIVNIGMNLGILPVTGLPLPLLSFGGTHIIIELLLLGVLHSIYRHS